MVLAVVLASCEGKPGRDGRDGLVNYYKIPVQINQNEWKYTDFDNNNYFYATISMPEITGEIYQHGNIMVYREYDTGTAQATQTPLPYVRHKEYLADEATQILMTSFYEHLLQGQSKRQAFKQAQQHLRSIDNGQYDHPQFWASFILLD